MHSIKQFIVLIFSAFLITACTKKEKQDEIVVKEYLEIEAVCIQNNDDTKILFAGYLAHIVNKTKNSGFRHGVVKFQKNLGNTKDNFIAPSKVKFSKISQEDFQSSNIKLDGLAYNLTNRDVFKTSCEVKILQRLDHQPK